MAPLPGSDHSPGAAFERSDPLPVRAGFLMEFGETLQRCVSSTMEIDGLSVPWSARRVGTVFVLQLTLHVFGDVFSISEILDVLFYFQGISGFAESQ